MTMPVPVAVVRDSIVKTSDGVVKSTTGTVWWILISVGATGGTWELNDSIDDSGTDKIAGIALANSQQLLEWLRPKYFETAIYADITGSNITLTVGYD